MADISKLRIKNSPSDPGVVVNLKDAGAVRISDIPTNTEIDEMFGVVRGHVYGASWDGSSSTILTRTDAAALFSNPDPYVADGEHSGSSPFDNLMPWSGIVRETVDGNEMVKIPKFWFKIAKTGDAMTFQIADYAADGFHVSPAHMDRGDGKGERDYVYVGRYHCDSTYGSTTGVTPNANMTRAQARTGCHNLGTNYWLFDFAMFWTIRMLYIVEFADLDSQKVIGYSRGNGSSASVMGYTDTMPYHTGTMASNRKTYGANTQYRYIEGIWDNVYDWCDGVRFQGANVYTYLNPSEYSDDIGGTLTGTRPTSSGYISAMSVPDVENYEWALYPSSCSGSEATYFADNCDYSSSGVVLFCGGYWFQFRYCGIFYLDGYYQASYSNSYIGARLQMLP